MKIRTILITAPGLMLALALGGAAGCGSNSNGNVPTGTGGSSGGGGNGGSGTVAGMAINSFDTDVEGFMVNSYNDPMQVNLGATQGAVTMTWDDTEGSPTKGCLKVVAPFTDYGQYVDIQKNLDPTMMMNFMGKTLHVKVKVASGYNADPSAPAGAQPHVQSAPPETSPYSGQYQNVAEMTTAWQEFTWSMTGANYTATGFDASMVVSYGIQLTTGMPPASTMKPTTATIYIDTFSLQ